MTHKAYVRDVDTLRFVKLDTGHTLQTWDLHKIGRVSQHEMLGYRLADADGNVIFEDEDFGCSPLYATDSDNSLRSLLGFLTMRPGDTDKEYFENYTPQQLQFANEHGEMLSMLYGVDGDPEHYGQLEDINPED